MTDDMVQRGLLLRVKVPDEAAALGLATALAARAGTEQKMVDRSILLDMPVPPDAATRAKFDAIVKEYREADHAKAIDAVVDKIDALIAPLAWIPPISRQSAAT